MQILYYEIVNTQLTIFVFNLSGFCLKCYFCSPHEAIADGKSFTPQQCEKNQTEVTCDPNLDRCIKAHQSKKMEDGNKIEREFRGCINEQLCDALQKWLEQQEMFGWDFDLACCNSELCNKEDIVASEVLPWLIYVLSWAMVII